MLIKLPFQKAQNSPNNCCCPNWSNRCSQECAPRNECNWWSKGQSPQTKSGTHKPEKGLMFSSSRWLKQPILKHISHIRSFPQVGVNMKNMFESTTQPWFLASWWWMIHPKMFQNAAFLMAFLRVVCMKPDSFCLVETNLNQWLVILPFSQQTIHDNKSF